MGFNASVETMSCECVMRYFSWSVVIVRWVILLTTHYDGRNRLWRDETLENLGLFYLKLRHRNCMSMIISHCLGFVPCSWSMIALSLGVFILLHTIKCNYGKDKRIAKQLQLLFFGALHIEISSAYITKNKKVCHIIPWCF